VATRPGRRRNAALVTCPLDEPWIIDNSLALRATVGRSLIFSTWQSATPIEDKRMAIIPGTTSDDNIIGTEGFDIIDGSGGDDTIEGLGGGDTITGGRGVDQIFGGDGNDTIFLGPGAEQAATKPVTVETATGNSTAGSALILDSFFGAGISAEVTDADAFEWVTVDAVGSGGLHFYSVTVDIAGTYVFDIDREGSAGTLDSYLELRDESQLLVASNDDGSGPGDAGSVSGLDSFISVELQPGTYTLEVSQLFRSPIASGVEYRLHVTSSQPINTTPQVGDGGAGDDTINGGADADIIFGDEGDDFLSAGRGDDIVFGGVGDDIINGGFGNDELSGDDGDDEVNAGVGDDTVSGGLGRDILQGGKGDDAITGDGGADQLFGGQGNDQFDGGAGRDSLFGGAGDDTLVGGGADDELFGAAGDDALSGGGGNDLLRGADGEDVLDAGAGDDTLDGGSGDDDLSGGDGDDLLAGANGDDVLDGGAGDDDLDGGNGNDELFAGTGTDTLRGGAGDDTLHGGAGEGPTTFVFNEAEDGFDTVIDFKDGDVIALEGFDFADMEQAGRSFIAFEDSVAFIFDGVGFVVEGAELEDVLAAVSLVEGEGDTVSDQTTAAIAVSEVVTPEPLADAEDAFAFLAAEDWFV